MKIRVFGYNFDRGVAFISAFIFFDLYWPDFKKSVKGEEGFFHDK